MGHGSFFFESIILLGLVLSNNWTYSIVTYPSPIPTPVSVTPSPTYDPLTVPILSSNPNEFELGKYLYYFHCMPCHGDLGQGLTDSFRMIWEEHSNCWDRGCHAGRLKDEGFPIPTIVPAIIGEQNPLARFDDLDSLTRYLHETHPPQSPGKLTAKEYHAIAAFLWKSNNRSWKSKSTSSHPAQATLSMQAKPLNTVDDLQLIPTTSPVPIQSASYPPSAADGNLFLMLLGLSALVMFLFFGGSFLFRRWREHHIRENTNR